LRSTTLVQSPAVRQTGHRIGLGKAFDAAHVLSALEGCADLGGNRRRPVEIGAGEWLPAFPPRGVQLTPPLTGDEQGHVELAELVQTDEVLAVLVEKILVGKARHMSELAPVQAGQQRRAVGRVELVNGLLDLPGREIADVENRAQHGGVRLPDAQGHRISLEGRHGGGDHPACDVAGGGSHTGTTDLAEGAQA
jgi:hypothetical protein